MSEYRDDRRQMLEELDRRECVCTYALQVVLSGGSFQGTVSRENGSTRQGSNIEIGRYGVENGCGVV